MSKNFFPHQCKAFHTQMCVSASLPFCYLQHDKAVSEMQEKKKPCCSDWMEVKGQAQRPSIRAALSISAASPAKVTPRWNLREKRTGCDPATRCSTPVYSSPLIPWRPGRQTPPPPTPTPPHPPHLPPTNKTALCRRAASIQRAGTCGRTPQKTG